MSQEYLLNQGQLSALEQLSQERGIPVARLVKQAIDRFIETETRIPAPDCMVRARESR